MNDDRPARQSFAMDLPAIEVWNIPQAPAFAQANESQIRHRDNLFSATILAARTAGVFCSQRPRDREPLTYDSKKRLPVL